MTIQPSDTSVWQAKIIALEIYMSMHEIGRKAWLDVKMPRRDMKAMVGVGDSNPFRDVKITPIRHASFDPRSFYMQEDGVKDCKAFVMIITNNNIDSYFSREMCRNEVAWRLRSTEK